jgi:hypothetical protein
VSAHGDDDGAAGDDSERLYGLCTDERLYGLCTDVAPWPMNVLAVEDILDTVEVNLKSS